MRELIGHRLRQLKGRSRWALPSIILIFIFTAIITQNCGKGFETMEMMDASSLAPLAASAVISCNTGNKTLSVGEFVEGYLNSSTTFPEVCGQKVKSICQEDGTLSVPAPLFETCVNQCKAPDGSILVAGGTQTFISYSVSGGTQSQCDAAKVLSTCTTSGMQPDLGNFSSCKVDNNICAYPSGSQYSAVSSLMEGGTASGYTMASATYPQLCGTQKTSTCQASGTWSGPTPLFKSCAQSCVNPFSNSASTEKIKWFAESMAPPGACTFTESTCSLTTGTYSPSIPTTASLTCSEVGPASISLTLKDLGTGATSSNTLEVISGTEVQINFTVSADATEVKITSNVVYANIPTSGLTVGVTGSVKVKPTQASTFTITAKNKVGTVSTKSISVTVKAPPPVLPEHNIFARGEFTLVEGQTITNRTYKLSLEGGVVFIRKTSDGSIKWKTDPAVHGQFTKLHFGNGQGPFEGGNLVFGNSSGWTYHTNTWNAGNHLAFQSDGNLVVYSSQGVALWHLANPLVPYPPVNNIYYPGQFTLRQGESITNRTFKLSIANDMLLVTRLSDQKIVWQSNPSTYGKIGIIHYGKGDNALANQNLIVGTSSNQWTLHTGTTNLGHQMVFQNDGNLVINNTQGAVLWHLFGSAFHPYPSNCMSTTYGAMAFGASHILTWATSTKPHTLLNVQCMVNGMVLGEQVQGPPIVPGIVNPQGKPCQYVYPGGSVWIGASEIKVFTDSAGKRWNLYCGSSASSGYSMTVWKGYAN